MTEWRVESGEPLFSALFFYNEDWLIFVVPCVLWNNEYGYKH